VGDDEFIQEALPHLDMLYNLARRLTSSREEAEDLVQETYVRALRGWRRSRPDRISPWLATVCLNAARSEHRRRAVRPIEVLRPEPGEGMTAPADTAGEALADLDADTVRRAIAQLPRQQREAIALMDLCGFTASQAGEILGVPRNTVLSRVHRGHKRLALLLDEVIQRDS
jgi:RNA polymerase sigma-70 factor, ECF subfamily